MRRRLSAILTITLVAMVPFVIVYWPEVSSRLKISVDDEAVQLRIFYGKESLKTGLNWTGVGVGNFVNWFMTEERNLPRELYQPVHNIYLLVYSETGMLGLLAFVLFLIFLIKDFIKRTQLKNLRDYSFLLIYISILIIGFFDHFLFTIQQGRFMLWLVVALIVSLTDKVQYAER